MATLEYTAGAEIAMASLMGLLVIGETVLLYTFIKTTWTYVTFTPYVSFFCMVKRSFTKSETRYEVLSSQDDEDAEEGERTSRKVPETLKPFSWRKWFTID